LVISPPAGGPKLDPKVFRILAAISIVDVPKLAIDSKIALV